MGTNFIFILHDNNPDYDDIVRLEMYDTVLQESMGYVDFEKQFIDSLMATQKFRDALSKLTKNPDEQIIYLSTLKIHRDYRYKGYGKLLMEELLNTTLPIDFQEIDLIYGLPDAIDNDTPLSKDKYKDMLHTFYAGLGFSRCEEDEDYIVMRLESGW